MKALLTANQAWAMVMAIVLVGVLLIITAHCLTVVIPRRKDRLRLIEIMHRIVIGTYSVIVTPELLPEAASIVRKHNFRTKHIGTKKLQEFRSYISRFPEQFAGWPYVCDEISGKFEEPDPPFARKRSSRPQQTSA
jgi:hypothetical protein